MATSTQTNQQINLITARKSQVDDVYGRANSVVNLLQDVRLNLELVSEQKAVVQQVAHELAALGWDRPKSDLSRKL